MNDLLSAPTSCFLTLISLYASWRDLCDPIGSTWTKQSFVLISGSFASRRSLRWPQELSSRISMSWGIKFWNLNECGGGGKRQSNQTLTLGAGGQWESVIEGWISRVLTEMLMSPCVFEILRLRGWENGRRKQCHFKKKSNGLKSVVLAFDLL